MRAYCNSACVVATHDDHQLVDPAHYGEEIDVIIVPDDFAFERLGEWEPDPDRGETEADDPRPFARPALDLAEVKAQLKAAIDEAAEAERQKYITAGAGQAMTYQRKVEEARRLADDGEPDPADYPLLSASVGIDGADLAAVAAVVLGMDAAWAQIGAGIETARLAAKAAIDAAETEVAARAVEIVWPQPQQG